MLNLILVFLFHYSFSESLSLHNGKKYIKYQGDHLIKCSNNREDITLYIIFLFFLFWNETLEKIVNYLQLTTKIFFLFINTILSKQLSIVIKAITVFFSCVTLPYKKIELQPNIEYIEEISFTDYTKKFYFIINK